MMRLQSLLLLLVIVAVAIWGVGHAVSGEPELIETPLDLAAQVTSTVEPTATVTTEPTATAEPTRRPTERPAEEPTEEPTTEATEEPTGEPATRPDPPDVGGEGAAVVIERGESGRLEVALTFDAGEGPGYTEEILDLLAEHGIKATFGVTGQWAEQNPELMQRIVAEGHQIINHTYDHRSFTGFSPGTEPLTLAEQQDEVLTTEQIITDITGYESAPYFRYPYNDYDQESLAAMDEIGFSIIAGYTCDTMAWMGTSAADIADMCNPEAEDGGPGAVILMHVMQEQDYLALPLMIEDYAAAGYDFVTFEQIIQP